MARGRPSRASVYARLEHALDELDGRLGGLPSPEEAKYVWADIWHLEAHHSTALEGNTLVLREVEALLERGRAVGSKPLAEYMEVRGYGEAAQWVYAKAGDSQAQEVVTIQEVREIHHRLLTPVWTIAPHPETEPGEDPGNFRRHDIATFDGGMTPPSWALVEAELGGWLIWCETSWSPVGPSSQEPCLSVLPRSTTSSNVSTRFWTATAEPVDWSSISSWSGAVIRP